MIEERVSGRGSVSAWIVTPTGKRVTVQLPAGTDTPQNLAEVADVAAGVRG